MKQRHSLTLSLVLSVPLALAACAPADPVDQSPEPSSALPAEVATLHPANGAQVCPRPQVGADLILTDATRKDGAFDPSTVALTLDGTDITSAAVMRQNLTSPASRVTLLYTPPADLPLGEHRADLTFPTATGTTTVTWNFTIVDVPCAQ